MLGNKFLNIIGTLLLGSQFISFAKADAPELILKACTEYTGFNSGSCTNNGPATDYCIEVRIEGGNKKMYIYGVNGNAENVCVDNSEIVLKTYLNLVNPSKRTNYEPNYATNQPRLHSNPEEHVLVECKSDATECKQTEGYLVNQDSEGDYIFFNFARNKGGEKITAESGGIFDTSINSEDDCNSTNIGRVFGTINVNIEYPKICSGEKKIIDFKENIGKFSILNDAVSGTPFYNSGIVYLRTFTLFAIRSPFTNKDFCTNISNSSVTEKNNGVCALDSTRELNCVDGLCKYKELKIKPCSDYTSFNAESCSESNTFTYLCIRGVNLYKVNNLETCHAAIAGSLNEGLNLVKRDGTFINENNFSTKIEGLHTHPEDYILVYCKSSNCKQTEGYLVNTDGSSDVIFAFEGTNVGVVKTNYVATGINEHTKCATEHIGKLLDGDNKAICIANGKKVSVGDSAYYLLDGTKATGTPFAGTNSVVVKRNTNYIIKDNFKTEICVPMTDLSVADKDANGCEIFTEKEYICNSGECTKVPVCVATITGSSCSIENCSKGIDKFLLVETETENVAIKVTGASACQIDTSITGGDFCVINKNDIKLITPRKESFCRGDCEYYNCDEGRCTDVIEDDINNIDERGPTKNPSLCNPDIPKPEDLENVEDTECAFHCVPGYYIMQEISGNNNNIFFTSTYTEAHSSETTATGTLYHCSKNEYEETVCSSIAGNDADIGYYVNKHYKKKDKDDKEDVAKYIQCYEYDDEGHKKCEAVFSDPSKTACDEAADGELIIGAAATANEGLINTICLVNKKLFTKSDEANRAPISLITVDDAITKYMVPVLMNTETIFQTVAISKSGDKKIFSVVIEVGGDKAVLATKTTKKYRYADKDLKIYDDKGSYEICGAVSGIGEFVLTRPYRGRINEDKYDYYRYNKDYESSNNIGENP